MRKYLYLDDVKYYIIHAAVQHDVCKILCRLNVNVVHRLDRGQILLCYSLYISAAVLYVTDHTAEYPLVGIRLYIDLYIQKISEFLILEHHDALDYDNRRRLYRNGLIAPVMDSIVIYRTLDRLAVSELSQVFDEEVCFKSIRMVIVDKLALLKRYVVMSSVIVVIIDDSNSVSELIFDTVCKCRFAGTGSEDESPYPFNNIIFRRFRSMMIMTEISVKFAGSRQNLLLHIILTMLSLSPLRV